jgi:hypothetical protein
MMKIVETLDTLPWHTQNLQMRSIRLSERAEKFQIDY